MQNGKVAITESTQVRCEHGHLAAVIRDGGVSTLMRDGCMLNIPWPKVTVELTKKLNS
jgi:hypothetical protein